MNATTLHDPSNRLASAYAFEVVKALGSDLDTINATNARRGWNEGCAVSDYCDPWPLMHAAFVNAMQRRPVLQDVDDAALMAAARGIASAAGFDPVAALTPTGRNPRAPLNGGKVSEHDDTLTTLLQLVCAARGIVLQTDQRDIGGAFGHAFSDGESWPLMVALERAIRVLDGIEPTQDSAVFYHAHAATPDGGDEYRDAAAGEPWDGWTVYVRTETPDGDEPFDTSHESDYPNQDKARAAAVALALKLGLEEPELY